MKIELAWPATDHKAIVPVFLPFMGCKKRCIFCAQDRQSGKERIASSEELGSCLHEAGKSLEKFRKRWDKGAELAFYGGTFTALSDQAWTMCLDFIKRCRSQELLSSWRCSTRPDVLDERRLLELERLGCTSIELGIQSFDGKALHLTARGYDTKEAIDACKLIKKRGFLLGIHLMPGMPGVDSETFIKDMKQVCELKPELLRLHPCLVLAETGLEKLWQEGKFQSWSLPETIGLLARAWNMAREARITISRIGLAPEKSLAANIISGPHHPSLGSRVQAWALFYALKEKSAGRSFVQIRLPKRIQGCFWGWNGELKKAWCELGLSGENVSYWATDYIEAETRS